MVGTHEDFGSPGRAWHYEPLRAVGEYEVDFFEDKTYDFDFTDIKLFTEPGDIIETTDSKRLYRSMELLSETCGGDYTAVFTSYKNPKNRSQQEAERKNYFIRKPSGLANPRQSYTDDAQAASIIFEEYQQINHPAYQFIEQVSTKLDPEGKHDHETKKLWKDLTQTIAWDRYVQIYEEQIKAARLDN